MSAIRLARRSGGAAAMVFAMVLGMAGSADAQDVSATMLRVLAEAADQYRTGHEVFFVADYRFPHSVAGPFSTRERARQVQSDSGRTFGVFGPYLTRPDPGSDSLPRVVDVRLTIATPGGRTDTMSVDPTRVDALFFTRTAIDKFMIPYYAKVYGPAYANALSKGIRRPPTCHIGSIPCYPNPPDIVLIRPWDPVRGPLFR